MAPKKRKRTATPKVCKHTSIIVEPSFHSAQAGFTPQTAAQRAKAQGITTDKFKDKPYTFSAPLVLPEDDLAINPKEWDQSLASWTRLMSRRLVPSRNTIYVAAPPSIDSSVPFVGTWTDPATTSEFFGPSQRPAIEHVADYVRAFYHPMPVKVLPTSTYKFVSWSDSDTNILKTSEPESAMIGLQTPSEIIGIRTRLGRLGDFSRQLQLDALLDAAIASLPKDAFALTMLIDHDLYEDDDDDFVCGRAYGGSRVSVVSVARYNPVLDADFDVDLEHAWPLSHCVDFVNSFAPAKRGRKKVKTAATGDENTTKDENSPLQAAVESVKQYRQSNKETLTAMWLGRICRTASHELGHCFGMGHCVYYACCMQGSASIKEDPRQPPYLCPVDLAKVLQATGESEEKHLKAMLRYCQQHTDVELFVAYAAWLQGRLHELSQERVVIVSD